MAQGACSGLGPGLFFSDEYNDQQSARRTCESCPVRGHCLAWAVSHEDGRHGMWAGLSENQIDKVARAWRKGGWNQVAQLYPMAAGLLKAARESRMAE